MCNGTRVVLVLCLPATFMVSAMNLNIELHQSLIQRLHSFISNIYSCTLAILSTYDLNMAHDSSSCLQHDGHIVHLESFSLIPEAILTVLLSCVTQLCYQVTNKSSAMKPKWRTRQGICMINYDSSPLSYFRAPRRALGVQSAASTMWGVVRRTRHPQESGREKLHAAGEDCASNWLLTYAG
ncbi:hypothetical protein BKA67DRAFT_150146 [Truncatella angustata]|uniref:Secreted protein n=1 Tax=Truncatella angustata TaxID=152316 RepID=A0A9P8UQP4_9PEZI|nr:uncharacterized protein BKA67DRAFT_150146 [Truncatella angustata]KAH6656280.1 hypothetical protein BKA67DRAFT_150146 [Truncatella angustata]